ncbi:hypothetical protein [Micromonospora sp. NPDC048839]|uniref:hypothetical protein n=1 Tax=Micromonospora sp. NPDC048839 TaxID=3155641 RepID=UPI0033CD44ED
MIKRDSGRTSGLTDWHLMDVNSMWACLQDHETDNHWKQVAGWRKVCDLAQTHLSRLQEYRRGLAEAWPPETSAASSTYLAELDELIDKVQRTHNAAAANYTALSAATQAIGTTRAALRKIHEEYATKSQKKQAYESMAADPKAVMGNRVTESPVSDADLERLNVQARAAMFNLSGELQQAQATLQKPPSTPSQAGKDISNPDAYGNNAAPIIPSVISVPMRDSATITPSSKLGTTTTSAPTANGGGPILGGTGTGVTPNLNSITPSSASTSPPSTYQSVMPPAPPPISRTPASNQRLGGPPGKLIPNSPSGPLRGPASEPLRATPPGGVIGGAPGAPARQPENTSNPSRRVNPVGGVIGGGGAGTAPTGAAGSRPSAGRGFSSTHGMPPIGGAPGIWGPGSGGAGRLGRREDDTTEPRHWDPDNPWETQRGVNPVVLPPDDDGPVDPGPAIGMGR